MDITALRKKAQCFIVKYKYVLLITVLGVILLLIPDEHNNNTYKTTQNSAVVQENTLNQELAELLSQVKGAGKVRVFLTISNGAETVFQTDEEYSSNDTGINQRTQTITHTDAERNEQGLIKQINPPTYQGAIIVCQGADNPSVKLALINAVANATGLGTDKISVLKMK